MAAVVNEVFRPAIAAIRRWRGSVVTFGGDALLTAFTGRHAVGRAREAALRIQAAFAGHTGLRTGAGTTHLSIAQAIGFGRVHDVHLGDARGRLHLLVGAATTALARLEGRTLPGRITLSTSARARLSRELPPRAHPWPRRRAPEGLAAYVPAALLPLLGRFEGGFRSVAVLFAETRLSRGPHRRIVRQLQQFHAVLVSALDAYDGVLLKTDVSTEGTKWLCIFGIPAAHEEDPERAARAALEIVGNCPPGLAVRGGVHSGVVANIEVGTRERRCFDVMGDAVNTAARALVRARWGEVVVTEAVRRAVPVLDLAARGAHVVKGKAAPLRLHSLRGVRERATQVVVRAPLVGRNDAMEDLERALTGAVAGRGAVIALEGEAGLGKSRLKWETWTRAERLGMKASQGRAIAFGGATYGAVAALLRDVLRLPDRPARDAVRARVAEEAKRLGLSDVDGHHIADVLGARDEKSPLRHLDGRTLRLNNMVAVRSLLLAESRDVPHLFVLEDMHWADELSREVVAWLASSLPESSSLLLLCHRPGYEPPKEARRTLLSDLAPADVEQMLRSLLPSAPRAIADLVIDRASGNPFYVEEVVRNLLETGAVAPVRGVYRLRRMPAAGDLPEGIESLIEARLDRLPGPTRRTAQVAAVIGRSFSFDVLASIEEVKRSAADAVEELCRREIVFPKQAEYIFKHALTRDVAYATILVVRRRRLHRAVAESLERLRPGEREAFLPLLGHHWEHAGDELRARACYLEGARSAVRSYALEEAERLYRSYLRLADRPTEERMRARLELVGTVLRPRGLGTSTESHRQLRLCLAESRAAGLPAFQAVALRELGSEMLQKGRGTDAVRFCGSARRIARDLGDPLLEGQALGTLGESYRSLGRAREARECYEAVLGLARRAKAPVMEAMASMDLALLCQSDGAVQDAFRLRERALGIFHARGERILEAAARMNMAIAYQNTGTLAEAERLYAEALATYRDTGARPYEGIALANLAGLRQLQGERREALTLLEEALAIARTTRNRPSEAIALTNVSQLRHELGDIPAALQLGRRALALHRQIGNTPFVGITSVNLARLERTGTGDVATAGTLLAEAEALLRELGDRTLLAHCLCERVHLDLVTGDDGRAHLETATGLAAELGAGPGSDLATAVAVAERAVAARGRGEPLLRGQRAEDYPEELRTWLQTSGAA